jgi:hypothetical protein
MSEMQKDLLTNRWRRVKAPEPSELQIQVSLVQRLRLQARPNIVWFHAPNGEQRDPRVAAKLRGMGVIPGVSDLIFIWKEQETIKVLCLELKARKRKLSAPQEAFAYRVLEVGCYFEHADNIDDAVAILQKYRILP